MAQDWRRLSDSAGPSSAGEGYLSLLGLTFSADRKEVRRAFQQLALTLHPDKLSDGSLTASTEFFSISTAYQVLSSDKARAAYMLMYKIRCMLYQVPVRDGCRLAPYYVMHVRKKDTTGFLDPRRVITFDLVEGVLQNWKRDQPHRCTPLERIQSVQATGQTSFTIVFDEKGPRDYKLSADTTATAEAYISVLRALVERTALRPVDDAYFPPPSLRKGYVEKENKPGEWARRWVILGPSNLLIFHDSACESMVNAIALDGATSSVSILDFTWTLQAAGCAWRFRNSKQSIAQTWAKAVEAALAKPAESYAWLRPSGGDSQSSSSGDVDARRQPCLIRTSDDLLELTRTWEDEDVSTMLLDEKLEADERASRNSNQGDGSRQLLDDEAEIDVGRPSASAGVPAPTEAPDVSDSYPPTPRSTRRSSIAEGLSKMFLSIWPRGSPQGHGAPSPSSAETPDGGDMGATPNSGTEGTDPDDATMRRIQDANAKETEVIAREIAGQLGKDEGMVRNFL